MKLKEWALQNGIHPQTAYAWFHAGALPVRAERVGPRTILVFPELPRQDTAAAVLYLAVEGNEGAPSGEKLEGLREFAKRNGYANAEIVEAVDPELDQYRDLLALLGDPKRTVIIADERDIPGQRSIEFLAVALSASGRKLVLKQV